MLNSFAHSPVSILAVGAVVVIFLLILFSGYVKAPPDQAYIISGLKRDSWYQDTLSGTLGPPLSGTDDR